MGSECFGIRNLTLLIDVSAIDPYIVLSSDFFISFEDSCDLVIFHMKNVGQLIGELDMHDMHDMLITSSDTVVLFGISAQAWRFLSCTSNTSMICTTLKVFGTCVSSFMKYTNIVQIIKMIGDG